jgi:hypothetical protein
MSDEASPQPWRIKPVIPVTKGLAAIAVLVLVLAFGQGDPVRWTLACAVAAGLTVWMLRDLIAPIRLAADAEGVTVVEGFARRRRLGWAEIERVRVDRRERLGLSAELLEIDADDALHLFSMHDLGADPHEVLVTLEEFRAQFDKDNADQEDPDSTGSDR